MSKSKKKTVENVVTYNGAVADKNNCRRIDGEYYIIGDINKKDSGQVYQIDAVYYRENTGRIAWNYSKKCYDFINNMISGIADVQDGLPISGYFSPDLLENVAIVEFTPESKLNMVCISKEVALSIKNVVRDVAEARYAFSQTLDVRFLQSPGYHQKKKIPGFDNGVYSFENNDSVERANEYFNDFVNNGKFKIKPFIEKLSEFINGYTFGIEFETAIGTMPVNEIYRNGLIPVRDGSIPGHEYVTIVHNGAIGLQAVYNSCKSLQEWCQVDKSCSMHIHIGNIPRTKEFIVAFYMLCYSLQHELHELVAPYKKDLDYLANKNGGAKDHCKYLSSLGLFTNNVYKNGKLDENALDILFSKVFTWCNDGYPESKDYNFNSRLHIKHGRPKWEISSRYYWINIFNLLFSKSCTIENRLHSGTLNATKTINWLLITIALIEFAKNNVQEIIEANTKYKLDDIVERVFTGKDNSQVLISYLKDYISARKSSHYKMLMKHDIYGKEFVHEDIGFQPIETIKL